MPLADWEKGEVTVAVHRLADADISGTPEEEHLLSGLRVQWY